MLFDPAVAVVDLVLAVHILAVVVAFGVVFSYPVFGLVGARLDPTAMPWFHRMQQQIGRRLINPGLLVVLLAGIYLASKEHQWGAFYVQWGLGAVVVIGALEGAFMIPREGRLAELADRDLASTPAASNLPATPATAGTPAAAAGAPAAATPGSRTGPATDWSGEYRAVLRQTAIGGALVIGIVIVTVFLMATHAGA